MTRSAVLALVLLFASCSSPKTVVVIDGGGPESAGRDGGVFGSGATSGTGASPGSGGNTGTGGGPVGSGGFSGIGAVTGGGGTIGIGGMIGMVPSAGGAIGTGGRIATGGEGGTLGTGGGAGRVGSGGSSGGVTGTGGVGTGGAGTGGAGTGGAPGCTGLACMVSSCTGTARTSISGTIRDPAGKLPLYNVAVYVPNAPLSPVPEGVSCDRCSVVLTGNPIVTALTDVNGRFVLSGVPAGTGLPAGSGIPFVIQVGKWRRQITIPSVTACVDNPITDANLTRLPQTKAEGHIPKIAVTTGGSDAFECMIRRIGIADSEFTTDGGAGRVHLYAGGSGTNAFSAGGTFAPAATLWASPTKLHTYDVLVQSCEGSVSAFVDQKPQTSVDNVANYVNSGGRLLLSHLHYSWLQRTPAFSGTAAYVGTLSPPAANTNLIINQTFPRGAALAQWLASPAVNASPTAGQLMVNGSEHSVTSVNPPTTEWMYLPNNPNDSMNRRSVQHMSFDTPVGATEAMQCGRVGFTDIHVKLAVVSGGISGGGDDSDPGKPFPSGCRLSEMTPQQKAIEFMFFDLFGLGCNPSNAGQPVPP